MIILFGVLGLALGSFVNALVWRLFKKSQLERQQQKKTAKKTSAATTAASKKKSDQYSILKGRSMCPHCQHQLAGKDLIPVLSWLSVRGKCRYCQEKIAWQYPAVELAGAVLFMKAYYFWPYVLSGFKPYEAFVLFLLVITVGLALSVYDVLHMELPTKLVYVLGGLGFLFSGSLAIGNQDLSIIIASLIGSIGFGGFFYILYAVSGGKWIGGGDVRLGFALGLLLGWQKSILALTAAAYGGTVVIAIIFLLGRYHKKMKLPFGPFLLGAAYTTILFGQSVIDWYLQLSGL